jgi:hypothetical protein
LIVVKSVQNLVDGNHTFRVGFWNDLVRGILALVLCSGVASAILPAVALAQDDFDEESGSVSFLETKPLSLPAAGIRDTVRTNIWLTEALLAEIASRTARVLPPPPAAVRLVNTGPTKKGSGSEVSLEDDQLMFNEAMVRVLGGLGYSLFASEEDEAREGAVDYVITYQVVRVKLDYPDVGRTLGIWRQWIARELEITAQVEVKEADSGRILLADRITRSFSDRVGSGDLVHVDSNLYPFTTAEVGESGWRSRLEEMVVLGTLAGLVAVYFANTAD